MNTALDGIAFLANSENRVAVIRLLVEEPQSHDEICDRIGASRVTTARILREFEERDWITRSGQECTTTPTGEWVCDEFTRLLEEMEAERRLREPLQWMPSDLLTFDVQRIRDAELMVLEESDATAIIRRILEFRRSSDRIRGVTRTVAPVFIENDWESTVHGDLPIECILDASTFDAIRDDTTLRRQFREITESERSDILRYDEDEPLVMMILCDETVLMCGHAEQGPPPGTIQITDEAVRSWAESYLDKIRADSHSLDIEAFRS
jgi:predicted transcriptional regulator